MVYSIQTRGRKGTRILSNNRAIVLHQGGQCRRAGGMNGWSIRAQQSRRNRISCIGQPTPPCSPLRLDNPLTPPSPAIDSPCECGHNNPDSLEARLFPSVVLAVAPAVTMDEASPLSPVCSGKDGGWTTDAAESLEGGLTHAALHPSAPVCG